MEKNYYEILEIAPSASKEVIDMAYKALVKKYHPDNNGSTEASEDIVKRINEAYSVLSDEKKRAAYDAELQYGNETGLKEAAPVIKREEEKKTPFVLSVVEFVLGGIFDLLESIKSFLEVLVGCVILFIVIGLFTGNLKTWTERLQYYGYSVIDFVQKDTDVDYPADTAENVIDYYMEALYDGDAYEAKKCLTATSELTETTQNMADVCRTSETDEIMAIIINGMKQMDYDIKKDTENEFLVTFKTKDLENVYLELLKREEERENQFMLAESYPTDKELEKMNKEDIIHTKLLVYKSKKKMKYDVTFYMNKSNGQYLIDSVSDKDAFLAAFTGNLTTIEDELSESESWEEEY